VVDQVESRAGAVTGLGLVDVDVEFDAAKTLANPTGTAFGAPASGYEIHHGRVTRRGTGLPGLVTTEAGEPEGVLAGPVAATHWHGLLENDEVRRSLLRWAAELAGRTGFVPAADVSFADARQGQLDLLGDMITEHLDTSAVLDLLKNGAPAGLPFVPPGAP
jgi:adenosylcobyric acid synthase